MANLALPNRLTSSRPAWRAAAGTAAALLVVGGGAALGMGGGGRADHRVVEGGWTAARSSRALPSPAPPGSAGAVGSAGAPGAATDPGSTVAPPGATSAAVAVPAGAAGGRAEGPSDTGRAPVAATPAATAPSSTTVAVPAGSGGTVPAAPGGATGSPDPAPTGGLPATGTYEYATMGSQQVSLLGSNSYPSQTSVDVAASGCGVSMTWAPSPGGSDTVVECPVPGGVRVVAETVTLSIGGYAATEAFQCDPGAFIPVDSGQPGRTWTWSCHASTGETSTQVVELLGSRTAVVGGVPVDVEDVSVKSTLSGPAQGTINTSYWLTSNATPVSETGRTDLSMATVAYHSSYSLELASLTPSSG